MHAETGVGVVEGFYGERWPDAERLGFVERWRALGGRFYIYGPKDESTLRRDWRQPLPVERRRHLTELCRFITDGAFGVGAALSPYCAWQQFDQANRQRLTDKVSTLIDTGIDRLFVLFDDMPAAEPDLAKRQCEVIESIRARAAGCRISVCPTYYSDDPLLDEIFGRRPPGYLRELGRSVDAAIDLLWTGPRVVSREYTRDHLERVASMLRRQPLIWDNSLANDGRESSNRMTLRASAMASVDPRDVSGVAINPPRQPNLALVLCDMLRRRIVATGTSAERVCATRLAPIDAARLESAANALGDGDRRELDEARRARLVRELSGTHEPAIAELRDWLTGAYAFDPECLTD